MSRDQRAADNWALVRAFELGKEHNVAVLVVFNLVPKVWIWLHVAVSRLFLH